MKTHPRTVLIVTAIFSLLLLSAACSLNDLKTPERQEKGLVIVLPGIEGPSYWNYNLARGLADGGVENAIEIYDWGTRSPGGMLINLADYERNRAMAASLRDYIVTYLKDHPGRDVHVIGHSGGGGIAVLAAEMLPADKPISSVILLAAALSPDYDLRPALKNTRRGIFNYYSQLDAGFLGVGTSVAGTIDRKHTPAAGAMGFNRPGSESADGDLYRKLQQIKWDPKMRGYGHMGDHMGWTNPSFVRHYLAPLVVELGRPDDFE